AKLARDEGQRRAGHGAAAGRRRPDRVWRFADGLPCGSGAATRERELNRRGTTPRLPFEYLALSVWLSWAEQHLRDPAGPPVWKFHFPPPMLARGRRTVDDHALLARAGQPGAACRHDRRLAQLQLLAREDGVAICPRLDAIADHRLGWLNRGGC